MQNLADAPLVTVIICVYNAGEYLRPSLESILKQTYQNLEILLVDDGSTDGCMQYVGDLLEDPRTRVISQANAGKPAALNRALEAATGEFYVVHDADDISHPERINIQLQLLQNDGRLAAAFCGHELILNDRHVAPIARPKDSAECSRLIRRFIMPAHDPTGMYRLSAVGHMRYETNLPIVEGFDYILRVGEAFPVAVVGGCLYGYRIHQNSVTKRDPEKRERLVIEVLKRACDRRGVDFATVFPAASEKAQRRHLRNRIADNNLAAHFIDSTLHLRKLGLRRQAFATSICCARLHPLDPHYYKAAIYAAIPEWAIRLIRRGHDGH